MQCTGCQRQNPGYCGNNETPCRHKEEREHSRRQIAITSGGAGVVSDGQRGKDEGGVQKESSKDEHGNRRSLRK